MEGGLMIEEQVCEGTGYPLVGIEVPLGKVVELSADGNARILSDEEATAVVWPEGPLGA